MNIDSFSQEPAQPRHVSTWTHGEYLEAVADNHRDWEEIHEPKVPSAEEAAQLRQALSPVAGQIVETVVETPAPKLLSWNERVEIARQNRISGKGPRDPEHVGMNEQERWQGR